MLGETVRLGDDLWVIRGEMPPDASAAPDWCNVVLYRVADRTYLIDSGGGPAVRASIDRLLDASGPSDSFTLINTHAHLDHLCNNDLVAAAPAKVRHHYLHSAAIEFARSDFAAHMAEEFDNLGRIYDPFSSYRTHRGRYAFAAALRDILGPVVGRRRVLRALFGIQLRTFRPANLSLATMEAIDRIPSVPVRLGDASWNGWTLGDGDVQVWEAGAHAPGDLVVYLPEPRLLCTGDITFPLFPTFGDSSRARILAVLEQCSIMAGDGLVEYLVDGHADRCFRGAAEVKSVLDRLAGDHLAFEDILRTSLLAADGLTPAELYTAFAAAPDQPVVQRYLDLEFPRSPPSLQNVIVNTLLQLGIEPRGPAGRQRFYGPVPAGAGAG